MTSAVDYLVLTVVHRTNEDWFMRLPLSINDLVGATASCLLINANGGYQIELDAVIEGSDVVLTAQSEVFEGKFGGFSGDVLITLSGGRDIVTHLINLELQRGITRRG